MKNKLIKLINYNFGSVLVIIIAFCIIILCLIGLAYYLDFIGVN